MVLQVLTTRQAGRSGIGMDRDSFSRAPRALSLSPPLFVAPTHHTTLTATALRAPLWHAAHARDLGRGLSFERDGLI